jgi:hypothetical protein
MFDRELVLSILAQIDEALERIATRASGSGAQTILPDHRRAWKSWTPFPLHLHCSLFTIHCPLFPPLIGIAFRVIHN